MLKIWGRATSTNTQKVIWCCEELALPYERADLGGKFGGLDDPTYRTRNPNGLIPTIDDNGFILWESNAILRYLASGNSKRSLFPAARHEAAPINQWLDWQMIALGWRLRTLFMLIHRPAAAPAGETMELAAKSVADSFTILDRHLSETDYAGGTQFSIADIALGISTHRWFALDIERPTLPALHIWYERISARPAFASVSSIQLN